MSVVIETTLGDITVDLFVELRPQTCLNFLKLCKMKYYNFNLFHTIQSGFIAQTGDPTGEGSGGQSIWGLLHGKEKRYFSGENMPKIRHSNAGLLSMVCTGDYMIGSQFFFTLAPDLDSLDGIHCVIGEVAEGHDVLRKLNDVICDENHRPYRDVRITHTVILEDPFNDPPGLREPSRSPSPSAERLARGRIAPDEDIDETKGKSLEEIKEIIEEREAKARATILEIVGDIPDADIAPPENVLFVCKLNQVTSDEDLEIIFSRFGKIVNCEVIRDKKTGNSLQYAFIEFADKKSCEDAYFKMDNVLIDDSRIHVDFSQSVSKVKYFGKGRVKHFSDSENEQQNFNSSKNRHSRNNNNQYNSDRDKKDYNHGNRDKRSRSKSSQRNKSRKENNSKESTKQENIHKSSQKEHYEKRSSNSKKYSPQRDNKRNHSPEKKSYKDKEYKRKSSERSNKEKHEFESKNRYKSDREYLHRDVTSEEKSHQENKGINEKNRLEKHNPDKDKSKDKHKSVKNSSYNDMLNLTENNEIYGSSKSRSPNRNSKKDKSSIKSDNNILDESYKNRSKSDKSYSKENRKREVKHKKEEDFTSNKLDNENYPNDMNIDIKKNIDINGADKRTERKTKRKASEEIRTPPKTKRPKKIETKSKRKLETCNKAKDKITKRRRKRSTSSESSSTVSSSSSSSSSSSDSSTSSESDHKKRNKRKHRRRKYSSSSSSSSTSSTSTESSSESSTTSSSSDYSRKKKCMVSKKKKKNNSKKR